MTTRKDTANDVVKDEVESGLERRPVDPYAVVPWEDATAEADKVLGRELAKDELFDKLVGVPFLITGISSYPGKGMHRMEDGTEVKRDFFACEARLAPANVMQQRRVNFEELLPLEPDSLVVFNDSSTGIRRQLVQYLVGSNAIELPEGRTATKGKLGESIYDLPVSEWVAVHNGEILFDPEGNALYTLNQYHEWRGLLCPRGIRISDYTNDYTDEGHTRYLA